MLAAAPPGGTNPGNFGAPGGLNLGQAGQAMTGQSPNSANNQMADPLGVSGWQNQTPSFGGTPQTGLTSSSSTMPSSMPLGNMQSPTGSNQGVSNMGQGLFGGSNQGGPNMTQWGDSRNISTLLRGLVGNTTTPGAQ